MELQHGFIVGIFNYCDRWCETCAFTSRCRLFADSAEFEAELDPNLKPIVDAPLLPQDIPPPRPKWLEELLEEANKIASAPITDLELAEVEPKVLPEHQEIDDRAFAYCRCVLDWLSDRGPDERRDPQGPVAVIAWFGSLNASKIHRALTGLAEDDGERDWPPDHEGSAKVALIGIERSHAAWRQLVSENRVPAATATPCLTELEWLRERLDAVFPRARAFVRPGFDEPDEVAKLFE
jgi:hypothetical protein